MMKTTGKNWALHHEFGSDNCLTRMLSAQFVMCLMLLHILNVYHHVVTHSQCVSCCCHAFSMCLMMLSCILNVSHVVVTHSQHV